MNSGFALRAAVATPHQQHDLCFIPKYKYKINKSRLRSIETIKNRPAWCSNPSFDPAFYSG